MTRNRIPRAGIPVLLLVAIAVWKAAATRAQTDPAAEDATNDQIVDGTESALLEAQLTDARMLAPFDQYWGLQ